MRRVPKAGKLAVAGLALAACSPTGNDAASTDGIGRDSPGGSADLLEQSVEGETSEDHSDGLEPATDWWWERAPHRDEVFGDGAIFAGPSMSDVVAIDAGFVAVGSWTDVEGGPTAAFWFSEDGLEWQRADVDAGIPASGSALSATVSDDGVVIAVGYEGVEPGVWSSSDGRTWQLVQQDWGLPPGGWAAMNRISTLDSGFVAVGEASGPMPAVWQSSDGLEWSQLEPEPGSFRDTDVLRGVTEGGPGLLVAGYDHGGPGVQAVVWSSTDGKAWERTALDSRKTEAYDVTAQGDRFVVVGKRGWDDTSPNDVGMVWTSTDGRTWSSAQGLDALGPQYGDTEVLGVRATPEGLVATGKSGWHPAIWASDDGEDWASAFPNPGSGWEEGYEPQHTLTQVAYAGTTMVVVGAIYYDIDRDGVTALVYAR